MFNARAFLVLGRVSNLPTVWSNCLCAWFLGGGGEIPLLLVLLIGLSLIYLGGMYLNDYCDAQWDREFRSERPIPSGQVRRSTVLVAVVLFFVAGLGCLLWSGWRTLPGGVGLILLIVLYNLIHKRTALSVVLMAACRTAIYFVVGAVSMEGVNPGIWIAGILMFFYVLGITGLARGESKPGSPSSLSFVALGMPVLAIAFLGIPKPGLHLLTIGLVVVWMVYVFRRAVVEVNFIAGKTIGPLLAGICLVDLAILGSLGMVSVTAGTGIMVFFIAALLSQRIIPAS